MMGPFVQLSSVHLPFIHCNVAVPINIDSHAECLILCTTERYCTLFLASWMYTGSKLYINLYSSRVGHGSIFADPIQSNP